MTFVFGPVRYHAVYQEHKKCSSFQEIKAVILPRIMRKQPLQLIQRTMGREQLSLIPLASISAIFDSTAQCTSRDRFGRTNVGRDVGGTRLKKDI